MKNKLIGSIGLVCGAFMLIDWFLSRKYIDDAYQLGHNTAAILGAMLLVSGLYYVFKKPKK